MSRIRRAIDALRDWLDIPPPPGPLPRPRKPFSPGPAPDVPLPSPHCEPHVGPPLLVLPRTGTAIDMDFGRELADGIGRSGASVVSGDRTYDVFQLVGGRWEILPEGAPPR